VVVVDVVVVVLVVVVVVVVVVAVVVVVVEVVVVVVVVVVAVVVVAVVVVVVSVVDVWVVVVSQLGYCPHVFRYACANWPFCPFQALNVAALWQLDMPTLRKALFQFETALTCQPKSGWLNREGPLGWARNMLSMRLMFPVRQEFRGWLNLLSQNIKFVSVTELVCHESRG